MTGNEQLETQQAYAQARAFGKDLARLYAVEKERRKALETTTKKLQAIFDTVPTALAVVDDHLTILEANPHFLALFEQTEACIGHPLGKLLPGETLQQLLVAFKASKGVTGSVEVEIKQPLRRSLLIKFSALGDNQGIVLVFYDLTERRRLESLKSEFVNIAAHELRTPLAGVMGFVSILKEDVKDIDNPKSTEIMDLILQSTERLKTIIDELVDFATTQGITEESLNVSEVNLSQIFHKSMMFLQPQLKAKQITYRIEPLDKPIIIRGDDRILTEVIYHLLENAVKFNKPQGAITVRVNYLPLIMGATETEGDQALMIEIEDTGIGIPQTELDKIFDKFYQVEEHLIRASGGLGLGLTIAQRGIQRHGGQLSVISQLGKGSTFQIILPLRTQVSHISIDNRLDIAYQQMLAYAKDMAQAVTSQRKLSKKMEQIKTLSVNLGEQLKLLSTVQAGTPMYVNILNQCYSLTQALLKLAE
ncbi:MAG: ATP-binding protein [Anaerolineae bacterium]